jgi:CHAT domain-containing protein
VNDKACEYFMKHFYDSYLEGASKAEALRAAKQKTARSGYAHPFYWASYVLTGEY